MRPVFLFPHKLLFLAFLHHLDGTAFVKPSMGLHLNLELPHQCCRICPGLLLALGYFWLVWLFFFEPTIFKHCVAKSRGVKEEEESVCGLPEMQQHGKDVVSGSAVSTPVSCALACTPQPLVTTPPARDPGGA